MWLLQLIGLVCLVGTAAGLVWFYGEQWLERRAAQKATEDTLSTFEEELNESDIIESTYYGKPVVGEVVATGPGRHPYVHERGEKDGKRYHQIKESSQFRPTEVRVGDIVHLGGLERDGYSFTQIIMDGALHLIVSEQDIAGIE